MAQPQVSEASAQTENMAKPQDVISSSDTDSRIRRNTIMTGLVDLSLLTTTAVSLKTIVDAGPIKIDSYYLLVTITALLLIVLVAILILSLLVYGPKIRFSEVEKMTCLRNRMAEFRRYFKKKHPEYVGRIHDDELLDAISANVAIEGEATTVFHNKVIEDYKEYFPDDVKTDKTDADIWSELRNIMMKYRNSHASIPDSIRKRNYADKINDVISSLSAIVLVLMILIGVFGGEDIFKRYSN